MPAARRLWSVSASSQTPHAPSERGMGTSEHDVTVNDNWGVRVAAMAPVSVDGCWVSYRYCLDHWKGQVL